MRVNTTVGTRDVRVRTHRLIDHHGTPLVAMRPVRGSDFDCHQIVVAELRTLCYVDGVVRDVTFSRVILESVRNPDGRKREAALVDSGTTNPNTTGRDVFGISVVGVNADFVRMKSHMKYVISEDKRKLVAYVDELRFGSRFSKVESELHGPLVLLWRQLHRRDLRGLRVRHDDGRWMIDGSVHGAINKTCLSHNCYGRPIL